MILKGLLFFVRSRCLPDFRQTAIKVLLDLQSTNANFSNGLRHAPRNPHGDEFPSNLVTYVLYSYKRNKFLKWTCAACRRAVRRILAVIKKTMKTASMGAALKLKNKFRKLVEREES